LGQALQPNPRFLGIVLHKDLTLLDFSFFNIFYAKTIDPRHSAGYTASALLNAIIILPKLCLVLSQII